MKRTAAILGLATALFAAAPASAEEGYAEWERCQRNAYYQLNFFDPTSSADYVDASLACARGLGADLTNLNRIAAWELCLITETRRGLKDPVGYMPMVITTEVWRCTAIYIGRDFEIPPDSA